MSAHASTRAVYFALGGNLLIALIKYIVSFITGSTAMLAESIHSTADTFNQVLLLIGHKRSQKAPTEMHSFGFAREELFWSMMVAVLLFFVGGMFSVYEGVHKIFRPEELSNIRWIFIVLSASIFIEAKSFQVAYKTFRMTHKQKGLLSAIRESTDVNLIVVLLEDTAALAGLMVVLITTTLSWLVHPVFDAIGSCLVGTILLLVSLQLMAEVKKMIIGESMPRQQRSIIKGIVNSHRSIRQVNKFQTMITGNGKYMVLLSVDLDDEITAYRAEDYIHQIKNEILKKVDGIETIYIEIKDAQRNQ